jgi:methylisocitrate lyase
MPPSEADPRAKRRALRAGIASGRIQRVAGAYSPLVAMAIEAAGFEGAYVGSSTMSTELGFPDIGLVTQTEAALAGAQVARVTALPTLIDIDTGYGEAVNVARTVRVMEEAGLAGCHLEDQVNPKRCGHLDDKQIVLMEEMTAKLRAAVAARRDPDFLIVARTDARAVEGMEAAIRRGRAYREAGADMLFPEALADAEGFAAYRKAVDGPLLANMTEFGKSELLPAATLQTLGYAIVLYPVTAQRLAMGAVEEGLRSILERGGQAHLLNRMQPRSRLYELIGYAEYQSFDARVGRPTVTPDET